MKKNIEHVGFYLQKITTEQFAMMLESDVDKDVLIELGTNLRFGLDNRNMALIVGALFKFEQNNAPFLWIEVACQFKILEKHWNKLLDSKNEESILFPKNFVQHLVVITVGTTRGVLHSKTENTKFNEFVLPTVNVNELIKEDVILEISESKIDL